MSSTEQKVTQSEIVRKHREFLFPAVATYYQEPVALVRGEGQYVWDDQGNRYPECGLACAEDIEELIMTTTTGEIAAFMAEPILGVGGFVVPPAGYFERAVEIARKHGGLFIADEVQTGWGRTGDKWFGIEHWNVEPDIMTSAKGMANGSPIGWTIATPEIADSFPGLTFSTFGGNPVSTAAALATIKVIEQENLAH